MDKALRLLSRNPPKVKIGGSSPPGIESFSLLFSVFEDTTTTMCPFDKHSRFRATKKVIKLTFLQYYVGKIRSSCTPFYSCILYVEEVSLLFNFRADIVVWFLHFYRVFQTILFHREYFQQYAICKK